MKATEWIALIKDPEAQRFARAACEEVQYGLIEQLEKWPADKLQEGLKRYIRWDKDQPPALPNEKEQPKGKKGGRTK